MAQERHGICELALKGVLFIIRLAESNNAT
jgi:hypothetical protein